MKRERERERRGEREGEGEGERGSYCHFLYYRMLTS